MAVIGVTGHTRLSESSTELVYSGIRDALIPYATGDLTGVTCLARGADQIFADVILGLEGRLEIVLPAADYIDRIPDTESRAKCDEYLSKASDVLTLPFATSGHKAYLAASKKLIQRSDLLIAVWDGKPSERTGGTADAVEYARAQGRQMIIVWPPNARRL